jgi:hypothetical protein
MPPTTTPITSDRATPCQRYVVGVLASVPATTRLVHRPSAVRLQGDEGCDDHADRAQQQSQPERQLSSFGVADVLGEHGAGSQADGCQHEQQRRDAHVE